MVQLLYFVQKVEFNHNLKLFGDKQTNITFQEWYM